MTTFTWILGILIGAFVTYAVIYVLKLRQLVKKQRELIKEQHMLIEALTFEAFGDEIKAKLKKAEEDDAQHESDKDINSDTD